MKFVELVGYKVLNTCFVACISNCYNRCIENGDASAES